MELNREQVALAVQSGLELLGPESEVVVPVKLNDGVFLLKQLLGGIAAGKIGLGPAVEQAGPEAPPTGNRKQRRTAKKVAKKKKVTRKKASRKKS